VWAIHRRDAKNAGFRCGSPGHNSQSAKLPAKLCVPCVPAVKKIIYNEMRSLFTQTYSDLRELIGFIIDALIVWKLTVSNVMTNAPAVVTIKTHTEISVWYSYSCSHSDR